MISNLRFVIDGCLQEATNELVNSPELVHGYWKKHIFSDPTLEKNKEHLCVLLLNAKQYVVGHHIVSTETLNECIATNRDILRPVLVGGGKDFLVLHNHPSGEVRPSLADVLITKKLVEAADLLHLSLKDHVIVSSMKYYSFLENGKI